MSDDNYSATYSTEELAEFLSACMQRNREYRAFLRSRGIDPDSGNLAEELKSLSREDRVYLLALQDKADDAPRFAAPTQQMASTFKILTPEETR